MKRNSQAWKKARQSIKKLQLRMEKWLDGIADMDETALCGVKHALQSTLEVDGKTYLIQIKYQMIEQTNPKVQRSDGPKARAKRFYAKKCGKAIKENPFE